MAMQTAPQFQSQCQPAAVSPSDPRRWRRIARDADRGSATAGWRKLLLQAEDGCAACAGGVDRRRDGSGKQTLARFLLSRSPLAESGFQRHDAREWLVTEADPTMIAGFIYLDRVDLLASPGQGLLLGVLKAMQDRPARTGDPAGVFAESRCARWPGRDC